MFPKTLLVATAIGAVTVSAQIPGLPVPGVFAKRQSSGDDGPDDVEPTSLSPECASAVSVVQSLYFDLPTAPADVDLSATELTDPCKAPPFTGTILSEYNSYTSALESFYTAHESDYDAIATVCAQYITESGYVPYCTSSSSGSATASPSTSASPSATASPSGNTNNTGSGGHGSDAAGRPTGTILIACGAAALMAAVAML
ncbi:hypothetical protein F5Y17DRAFT_4607 [Xylariaceae sp. FL0594]|nr:hypothetical protein F5Y17DRAFT_4607 [Xylariaceae sp. FL0594]